MRAGLGLELVNPGAGVVNFIIQTYSDPATEVIAALDEAACERADASGLPATQTAGQIAI